MKLGVYSMILVKKIKMIFLRDIENLELYRIHKRFACHVLIVPDYLVRSTGAEEMRKKDKCHKICEGKHELKKSQRRLSLAHHKHLVKKRKLKRKHSENA
jgi:hypothetical protein